MPLYEYECDACGERFEVIQKSFSSPPPEACENCGKGPVHRMQSSPAIQFKGSGFYITDYAKKGSSEGGESKGKSDASKTESTGDSKTSTAKTDSTATKDSSTKSDAPAASTSSESTSTSTKKD